MEILRRDRLIVRQIGADKNDKIGADPVGVRAGGCGTADGRVQTGGARRMADAGAGIDMIGTDEASDLLVRVICLVGKPAGG